MMTQMDVAPYRAFWRRRNQTQLTPKMRDAAAAARQEAERLSQILAAEFGAERVYLFGSFAWGPDTRPDSDLDLAVEGLPSGKWVFADLRLSNASAYTIDLIPLERLPTRLHDRILKSGLLVYDRQSTPTPL